MNTENTEIAGLPRPLNRSAARKIAIHYSDYHRTGKFTRVSEEFLDGIEAKLTALIHATVQRHRSVGKTLIDT